MATHKLGFLKINKTDGGFAFRFGEGKIHRLGLGKKAQPAVEGAYNDDLYYDEDSYADEAYGANETDVAGGYTGRFAQASGSGSYDDYGDDDYDDGYADDYGDDYADGVYADDYDDGYDGDDYDGYADDGYGDGDYADDGYDDGYYGGADDYADDYADRYSDEDAGDYDGYQDYGSANPVLRFIDENDWVTYALLFLLPPLGIYLLWRRRRFDTPIRWAISAVSGVWFIIILILLGSLLLSGGGDNTRNPPITMSTPTATADTTPEVSPEATTGSLLEDMMGDSSGSGAATVLDNDDGITPAQTVDALAPDATATPIPGYSGAGLTTGGTVLMTATGQYYHNNSACPELGDGDATSNVTQDVALQRGKTPCPVCYPGQVIYYSTSNGKYYHVDQTCSNMTTAKPITKEAAEERGQTPCPVCILHEVQSVTRNGLRFITESTKDESGIYVYCTDKGTYFHVKGDCSGMRDPKSVGLLEALRAGKTACPSCASAASTQVWCTEGGERYHNKSDCSGMRGAYQTTLAEALILKKVRCSTCWGNNKISFVGNGETGSGSGSSTLVSNGTVYVYATEGGQYYHTNETCSGMKNAQRVPLSKALKAGRAACPTCASSAETTVYSTSKGTYYHSYATCSGMSNASAGTMAEAMAAGKQRCPNCWASTETTGSSGVMVWATKNGQYYHTNSSCSGMKDASQVSLAAAVKAGKTACPTCASAANRMVYSTEYGQYYHSKSNCSGMKNAQKRTLQDALLLGQTACPTCIGSTNGDAASNAITNVKSHKMSGSSSTTITGANAVTITGTGTIKPSTTYRAGTSGVKVYATSSGKYYHRYKAHAGSGAVQVSLETALNYGKTACPTCIKVASTTVYAVKGGRYYHKYKSCAGSGAKSVSLATALANGLDACPVCVTRSIALKNTHKYKSGASGIKVYVTVSGKYYHTSKADAGSGAIYVTLETAMNYGKTACPGCASAANITVYATKSGKYYHASRQHAGSNASSGHWATALAMGKKACPVCVTGSEAYEDSDVKYPAGGDTRVFIDPGSSRFYYHKSSRCSEAGFSGGTGVTLEFVIKAGFHACPFCNPPTSIS